MQERVNSKKTVAITVVCIVLIVATLVSTVLYGNEQ